MPRRRNVVKSTEINLRTDPKIKAAAMKAAELERRTLSSLIEWLLVEHCKRVGTLKRPR